MDDLNCKYVHDHLTYAPRGITVQEYGYLAASGYWSAQIYWREGGLPFILHEFLRIPEGEVLEVWPVGNHNLFDAAVFINHRIADVYHYVLDRTEAGVGLPKFDLKKWQLGPVPGSSPSDPFPRLLGSELRKIG